MWKIELSNTATSSSSEVVPLQKVSKGTHFIWPGDNDQDFSQWYNSTEYAKAYRTKGNPNWASTNRRSDVWDAFIQCVDIKTGKPGMACQTFTTSTSFQPLRMEAQHCLGSICACARNKEMEERGASRPCSQMLLRRYV